MSFEQCAKDYVRDHRAGWKNAKQADQWISTLKTWVYPFIGKLSVGGITTDLVLKVLQQPIDKNDPDGSDLLDRADGDSQSRPTPHRERGGLGLRQEAAGGRESGPLERAL